MKLKTLLLLWSKKEWEWTSETFSPMQSKEFQVILFKLESVPPPASTHPTVVPVSLLLTRIQTKLQWTMSACFKVLSTAGKILNSTLSATACNVETRKLFRQLIFWDNHLECFSLLQFFFSLQFTEWYWDNRKKLKLIN